MRQAHIPILALVVVGWVTTIRAETNSEKLISETRPDIQEQVKKTYAALLKPRRSDIQTNCEAYEELDKLKNITKDKARL